MGTRLTYERLNFEFDETHSFQLEIIFINIHILSYLFPLQKLHTIRVLLDSIAKAKKPKQIIFSHEINARIMS